MSTLKLSVFALMITSTVALSGCGKLLDKLKGVSDDAGSTEDTDSGEVAAEVSDAGEEDAAADAAVAVVLPVGDRIPAFTAEENLAQKEINAQNYKTQLTDLDNQVKALK